MSEEIKVFKCDECDIPELCLSGSTGCDDKPVGCHQNLDGSEAPWQPTNDYQIIEKGKIIIDPKSMELDKMYICERIETSEGSMLAMTDIEDEIHSGSTFKDFVITKKEKSDPRQYLASTIKAYEPEKDQTPNCAICNWKRDQEETEENYATFACAAQGLINCDGYDDADGAWNSPECQKLFQPKYEPIIGPSMEELEKLNKSH